MRVKAGLIVLMVSVPCSGAVNAPLYHVTQLGTLGGTQSFANGINSSGQVVGWAYTARNASQRAFVYRGAGMQDLGTFTNGGSSVATAITDDGDIVGYALAKVTSTHSENHASRWTSSGSIQDLGSFPIGGPSQAWGANNVGQVVGNATTASAQNAFLYSAIEGMRDLGGLDGRTSQAFGINNWGQVVGSASVVGVQAYHAFWYVGAGPMQDLGTLPGGHNSEANDVNDLGQIVGDAWNSNNIEHAFSYTDSSGMIDLGTLGGTASGATAINNGGQIVGWASAAGNSGRAFLYSIGDGMRDLNTLIEPAPGFTLTSATGINELGWICGYGLTAGGSPQAYLLTPIPEPSSIGMILLTATVGMRRSRRCI